MIKIRLKDGSERELESGISCMDAAKAISQGLARAALACRVDDAVHGMDYVLTDDCDFAVLTFDDDEGRRALRHSASHILAQAMKRLHPEAKLGIGPAIENGFYYDFDLPEPLGREDLDALEEEMRKIAKEAIPLRRFVLPRDAALALIEEKNEPYKLELIRDLAENEEISFYEQKEFTDLCAGPHIPDTSYLKAFKLTSCTGAYWRGDAKSKMLNRVYGTAFMKKAELDAYLEAVEEAKKRDHNKIGRELEFFTTVDYIGQGLPILMPKGAKTVQLLQRFVEDEEERRGYLLTKTPFMAKRDLYKVSGHWDHYREGMFIMGDADDEEAEVFALRPMTCPFQFQVYLNKTRSYRDLPMRFNETSTLFRNESSGEMHGLIRVRQFTISEGHLACRPDQVEEEFRGCIDLSDYMLKAVGLRDDVSFRFSKWDPNNKEKYIGSEDEWEKVQALMKDILDRSGLEYEEAEGDAAFYGPKLDIQIKNVHGKEDTLVTIQIDFQLAERFGMEYVDADGSKKHPYVIHRTSIGCYERTLALLIEKYAGALPVWLAPEQVRILPITDRQREYADNIAKKLRARGIRVETDARNEKIGFKIREAQLEKVPYMLVVGDKELESGEVSVRSRALGDMGTMTPDAFSAIVAEKVETLSLE